MNFYCNLCVDVSSFCCEELISADFFGVFRGIWFDEGNFMKKKFKFTDLGFLLGFEPTTLR